MLWRNHHSKSVSLLTQKVGRANLLEDVIFNLSLCSSYYQRKMMKFSISSLQKDIVNLFLE
jgi:hypothetical protein